MRYVQYVVKLTPYEVWLDTNNLKSLIQSTSWCTRIDWTLILVLIFDKLANFLFIFYSLLWFCKFHAEVFYYHSPLKSWTNRDLMRGFELENCYDFSFDLQILFSFEIMSMKFQFELLKPILFFALHISLFNLNFFYVTTCPS